VAFRSRERRITSRNFAASQGIIESRATHPGRATDEDPNDARRHNQSAIRLR